MTQPYCKICPHFFILEFKHSYSFCRHWELFAYQSSQPYLEGKKNLIKKYYFFMTKIDFEILSLIFFDFFRKLKIFKMFIEKSIWKCSGKSKIKIEHYCFENVYIGFSRRLCSLHREYLARTVNGIPNKSKENSNRISRYRHRDLQFRRAIYRHRTDIIFQILPSDTPFHTRGGLWKTSKIVNLSRHKKH